ncbi:amine oxidase [Aaosphaeria arxii CBS 175.79]|uniref:Amine oxidase n=1 Tax=Aaosphaeria arxii CBS 175.79 TaxID=1450172 RepID=A0A6A5Y438_9PLEO|nr:amine oxidase [Aaosphaeria arxii CBS 175.79]KAF2020039.1 amine oxidase [Aaosphaeria arxii CBS 175.79]
MIPQVYGAATPKPLVEVDVVVVGGGFSGLMSGYNLQQSGLKTVVLEAKEQIGGRSRSFQRKSGPGVIELGATWINNRTQPEVFALTEQFGLETAEQFTDGDTVFQGVDGKLSRMPPGAQSNSEDPIEAVLEGKVLTLIAEAAEEVDIRDFDKFPKKKDVSFADWVALHGLWKFPHVQGVVTGITTSIVGRAPEEVGAHYFLDYVKSGNGLISLLSEGADGAQSLKVKKGTTSIATSLVNAMENGTVLVSTPVKSIKSCDDDTSIVTTKSDQAFKTKKVIIAIPTNMYKDIEFDPPLPKEKGTLVSSTKPGIYAKLILSYSEPWWRNAGLVGKFTSFVGPICFGWDTSDLADSQYSLAFFVSGDIAAEWHELPQQEKEDAIVEHLATLVGEELAENARDVLELNYVEWTKEEYLEGAPTSSMGPGLLRKYGAALREPYSNLHFGGGETAYEWKGYLEGAITAGKRAAQEVIDDLGADKKE